MTQLNLSPDDPRLTAYALGELEGAEAAAVAAAVRADPALQAVVQDVRALAGELETALAAEPPLAVAPDGELRRATPPKVLRFPYYWVAGLAAAAFAVLVAVRDEQSPVPGRTVVYELDLQPTREAGPEVDTAVAASAPVAGADEANLFVATVPPSPAPFTQTIEPVALPLAETSNIAPEAAKSLQDAVAGTLAAEAWRRERLQERQAVEQERSRRALAVAPMFAKASAGGESERPEPARWGRAAPELNTEGYATFQENPFLPVRGNALSTFAVDVDTASYANVRRLLRQQDRPPRDAVRIEELVNYFPYDYAAPSSVDEAPFAAHLEVASAPWAPEHRLVRIGLKGREAASGGRPAANLVFLLDVSGSMAQPNKLPLVQDALRQLLARLQPDDRVAIVTYAGSSGLALPSTPVRDSQAILAALDALTPGGSTHASMGIHLAYDVARANFVPDGINRVVLCTDGDFNVGTTSTGELADLVAGKARTGVFLTALGFGAGNFRDDMLERLADRGNGNYGYIDSLAEARKLLVEQVDGTLLAIAQDVKVQVEFNPALVQAYRLIGYENRALRPEEFNDDTVDAGEIGAGHTVTALYEVIPAGVERTPSADVDALKYQTVESKPGAAENARELLTVKLRYKTPGDASSRRLEFPLRDTGGAFADASPDFRFAAAVAGFGLVLRDSPHRGSATLAQVLDWAGQALGPDAGGYRREFVGLVRDAMAVGYN